MLFKCKNFKRECYTQTTAVLKGIIADQWVPKFLLLFVAL